jgi:acyl-CoA oxidase
MFLNFGLNFAKRKWAAVSSSTTPAQYEEVIRLCCAIKPLITWNGERCASIARERCGGQGYLSVNRIEQNIGFAHAGLTAEGDNAVLAQKVAKEVSAAIEKGQYKLLPGTPKQSRALKLADNPEHCLRLLQFREAFLFTSVRPHDDVSASAQCFPVEHGTQALHEGKADVLI